MDKDTAEQLQALRPWHDLIKTDEWQMIKERLELAAGELRVVNEVSGTNEEIGQLTRGRVAASQVIQEIVNSIEADGESYVTLSKALQDQPTNKIINIIK